MKRYVFPLLLVMLTAVSCSTPDVFGASGDERINVKLSFVDKTSATLSVSCPGYIEPQLNRLSVYQVLDDNIYQKMPFSASDFSNVRLNGLKSQTEYTIRVVLEVEKSYPTQYYSLMSSDVTFKTK